MASGWIKLHRELIEKSIWLNSTPEQKAVLITILLKANHKDTTWEFGGRVFKCNPGQFVTSLSSLALTSGVTIQNVRTAIDKFEKYDFLTNVSTKTGRLITVVNWEIYQCDDVTTNKEPNKELTKSQQRANKELTNRLTPNKNKEIKNFKEKEINKEKERFGEFENVLLTADEYRKLSEKFPNDFRDRIERLSCYMASQKKSYASHYATILAWARKDEKDNPPPPKKYKEFQKEVYERDDFKSEQMPEEIKNKLSGIFTKGEKS